MRPPKFVFAFIVFILIGSFFGIKNIKTVYSQVISTQVVISVLPADPSNLSAQTASPSQITLTWTDNSINEEGFRVERKLGSTGSYQLITTTNANVATFIDSNLASNTEYFYRIYAFNSDGDSGYSNIVSATTLPPGNSSGGTGAGGSGGGGSSGADLSIYTSAKFTGLAYPGSKVTLLKDGVLAATVDSSPDARFSITITNQNEGSYSFGVFSEDSKGNRSLTQTFSVTLSRGATVSVSGIFLSPSIAADKIEVKKGDIITFFGQSAPNVSISVMTHSNNEVLDKVVSDSKGEWVYKLDTTALDYGSHNTVARAGLGSDYSNLSKNVGFRVSDQNIPAPKKILKGDLNEDGRVNIVDFSILAYWYKRTGFPIKMDLNEDGRVNLVDFSIMAYYWTG